MKKFMNNDLLRILLTAILFITSYFIKVAEVSLAIIAAAYIIISYEIYISAFKHLKNKTFFDENVLMIIATICAFIIGSYHEAVIVMLLFEIGEYFSDLAVSKSKESITNLLDLRVETVNLVLGNELIQTPIKKVKKGDLFLVKPGEKIPLDGIVIEGTSHLDTSLLTGEPLPRKATIKDNVLSGFINQENILKIEATTTYKTTTAAKIINLIENSTEKKTETEQFITRFCQIYTPVVVVLAILLAIIPTLLGAELKTWLYRSLVFLVTSCPCALVISIPLAYFCGIGRASREGILIKGSKELESLDNIDYAVFDKTGTITEGVFEVTKVYTLGMKEERLLQVAASAEEYSLHPIAAAIKAKNTLPKLSTTSYNDISGKGISCKIKNKQVLVGNEALLKDNNIITLPVSELGTISHIAINGEYMGYIVISDKIKKSAKNIKSLKTIIKKDLVMLSGDLKNVVQKVARKVGITKYYGELLPHQKVAKVQELKKDGKVLFVGDGVNDAPVLKVADIGISMGQTGSDAAIEASDIVIMQDDLSKITTAIKIAHNTKKKIIQTIVFTLTIKIIVLLLGALGLSTVWMAVFADVGVTFIVILNVLTIMWKKID